MLPRSAPAVRIAALALFVTAAVLPSGIAAAQAPETRSVTVDAATPIVPATWTEGLRSYLVLTAPGATAALQSAVVAQGGQVFAVYDAIGAIVAHSADKNFASLMRAVSGVHKVGATRTSDVPQDAYAPALPAAPNASPVTLAETTRWDMTQIGADKAWNVNPGSASIKVGVLDTGVDDLHPDLAPNFLAADSVSCAYGKADDRAGAWRDIATHGTHVAGTIAAARNGNGVVGVAPGVKIAAVRVAEPQTSMFFAENTVCGFMWAGDHGFAVTNNSYYTDPWMFNCPDDPDQAAIIEGVTRAALYAESKGTLHVAAAGNSNYNLAAKTTDSSSPNDSTPVSRVITNDCVDIPTELPGVVTVAATTSASGKASYSNFGLGVIDVAAPGGDFGGGIYSTLPGGRYGNMNGTSMASPHVAGVAALLASVNPGATPAQLRLKLAAQATDLACPTDGRCTGEVAKNAFFGEGRVDALKAVTETNRLARH